MLKHLLARVAVLALVHPHQRPPQRRGAQARTLRIRGQPVPVARGLAAEGDHASGPQDAVQLGERGAQIGQVMQHRVPEDEVEGPIGERQPLGLGAHGLDLQAEPLGAGRERVEHPLGDVAGHGLLDQARAQQVEREVARPGADLERPAERPRLAAKRLSQLAEHLATGLGAEIDAPLGVVVARGDIVVADVCVLDLVRSGSRHAAADYSPLAGMLAAVLAALADHVQKDQPEGVPPLELTGERTLPDVPAENYWFRRHLAVYEWVAQRCDGLDVVDMACGEGYGTDVLARRAAHVTGVDANPEAHEHARLKYTRPGVRFVRDLVETYADPATPSSSARRSSTCTTRRRCSTISVRCCARGAPRT